ncbi:MAG: class I SAM-dependent methyltransferase [Hyphomicrobiaceae bacterium]|nr:class I SAM-dependent methyltransferase [Hyphomicrobiaceae bacterium]
MMSKPIKRRKMLKPDQRARIWAHDIKMSALAMTGGGITRTLAGLPKRRIERAEIDRWLADPGIAADYSALHDRAEAVARGERPKSARQVDCFVLYAIARGLEARRALEIGTHLGHSTLYLAAGLGGADAEGEGSGHLDTVDIVDVNDEGARHYARFGAAMSARTRLDRLGLAQRVHFHVGQSDRHLAAGSSRYDLIFIDGDHSETGAYFDMVGALARLADGGLIILHDYDNPDRPTPGIDAGQYGVHWAVTRLAAYCPGIGVLVLGSVTPPGAASPEPTSLAILTR